LIKLGDKKIIDAFYNESLRMYPPAYMLVRECLEKTTVGSYTFNKNDQIVIPLTELHRCSKSFPKPKLFIPERFLNSSHHKGSFLPFGTGAKSCAGTGLAYLEANIVLKEICQKFKLSRECSDIKTNAYITLHPTAGQEIKFTKRISH
jgi:cytochrome P450